jgi:transcriptional regulator of arginine metabolism
MNINTIGATRRRREEIGRLVRERAVRSQDELAALLAARGWRVTQPTLSRDLRALGLAKTPAGYVAAEALTVPSGARDTDLDRALAAYVQSVEVAAALVIVKTPPAGAHPVARALDEARVAGVVGTIAGDDTIFVAAPSAAAARRVADRLRGPLAQPQRSRRRA